MKFPISVQYFEKLRDEDYVYVDKTELIYNLVNEHDIVFLGRPRRFGKSLLMSTIHQFFAGEHRLFKGLAIDRLETNWTAHPVLHFDFNNGNYSTVQGLLNMLNDQLKYYEEKYGLNLESEEPQYRLRGLIIKAYEKDHIKPVVLIDEYDKPVLRSIHNLELDQAIRDVLKPFFSIFKSESNLLRFVMLTGVSKFGKLSVFSDLNNLEDISLNPKYADICGITKEELLTIFNQQIIEFAKKRKCTYEQMVEDLTKKYDGYRFTSAEKKVFNPFSLFNSLKNEVLEDYWFESGTPTFLIKLLKENNYDLSEIENEEIEEKSLYKVDNISVIPLLYQSGYLTIKEYDEKWRMCKLGFPNQEVQSAFLNFLIPFYSNVPDFRSMKLLKSLVEALNTGDIDTFMSKLKSIFCKIPYAHDNSMKIQEDQFRNLIVIVFLFLGAYFHVESPMSWGRSDIVLLTHNKIYIFEFKVNKTPKDALDQIHEKRYAESYLCDGRQIILIGVNYSTTERGITGWETVIFKS